MAKHPATRTKLREPQLAKQGWSRNQSVVKAGENKPEPGQNRPDAIKRRKPRCCEHRGVVATDLIGAKSMTKKKLTTAPDMSQQEITVKVWTGDLHERVMEGVQRQVEIQFENAVGEAIAAKVGELVKSIARASIAKAVEVALKEGWPRTDEYGGVKGVATLKDRIGEFLNQRERYGNSDRWIDKIVKDEATAALKGELGKEIEAARVKLRAEVDTVTRAKLNEALRAALGVS